MARRPRRARQVVALFLAALGSLLCALWAVEASYLDAGALLEPLTVFLAAFALASNLFSARWDDSLEISGSLVAALVAAVFVGPLAAFAVVVVAEGIAWAVERLRPIALPQNILGLGAPAVGAAVALRALVPEGPEAAGVFYPAFGGIALGAAALNLLIVRGVHLLHDGRGLGAEGIFIKQMLPVWGINIALTVAIASLYATAGVSAAALFLVGILVLTYQLRLVTRAEDRTRKYASLSWGVLSGMVRSIDMRDGRTARHSAAVAQFASDIAAAAGLSRSERELAHTAGLLHDVGKFALSDRVMEQDVKLTEEDWRGIRRHPELGATMLKDLGVYGPIAEIVRAHHERLDGRGYPAGLGADQIPEIARIVAVAEVYDTLTAGDTYRAAMSSFEALRELRRVAGSQLDPRYVEALAEVLEGTGVDYRHAAAADFDRELEMERRIGEAVGAEGASS